MTTTTLLFRPMLPPTGDTLFCCVRVRREGVIYMQRSKNRALTWIIFKSIAERYHCRTTKERNATHGANLRGLTGSQIHHLDGHKKVICRKCYDVICRRRIRVPISSETKKCTDFTRNVILWSSAQWVDMQNQMSSPCVIQASNLLTKPAKPNRRKEMIQRRTFLIILG